MTRRLGAGEDVDSFCTRCKLNLSHVIIAMVGEQIVKVKCNTCGSIHRYRGMESVRREVSRTGKAAPKTRPDMTAKSQAVWETTMAEAKGEESSYDRERSYRVGDVIVHPLFGKGVVQRTSFSKCTVLFREGEKLLASANR